MTIREMVSPYIPEGCFLRRDRGNALYITNAPAKGGMEVPEGFLAEISGNIAHIHIDPAFLESISEKLALPCDGLFRELSRFTGSSPQAARIFSDIMKAAENPVMTDAPLLEKRLRQAAAVALRSGGGEGLCHCARALAYLKNIIENKLEE